MVSLAISSSRDRILSSRTTQSLVLKVSSQMVFQTLPNLANANLEKMRIQLSLINMTGEKPTLTVSRTQLVRETAQVDTQWLLYPQWLIEFAPSKRENFNSLYRRLFHATLTTTIAKADTLTGF